MLARITLYTTPCNVIISEVGMDNTADCVECSVNVKRDTYLVMLTESRPIYERWAVARANLARL